MNVFVTGHRGYIGVRLVELLKQAGHRVTGCDLGLFDGCEWSTCPRPDRELRKDIRHLEPSDLEGHECVMHLAAISNDPMGALVPGLTYSVNRDGSIHLARLALQVGVPRFLFAGSCAVYGEAGKLDLDEKDALAPLTPYARSKMQSERAIAALAGPDFSPVFLRLATVYGCSPMLRLDLVANDLLAGAVATREIRVHSDGNPWRPMIYCLDAARAFLAFAGAPRAVVHNKVVNVGVNSQNYQVRDIAALVQRLEPGAHVTFTGEKGVDPRNYRVRFDLLHRLLPGFAHMHTLPTGMAELHRGLKQGPFSRADYETGRFVRLRTLRKRLRFIEPGIASES